MKFLKMNIQKPNKKIQRCYMWEHPDWGSLLHRISDNYDTDVALKFAENTKRAALKTTKCAVGSAFEWSSTIEGSEFWNNVHQKVRRLY